MMSSDSQAMGRVGEVVLRTWQTAHKMKLQRGALPGDPGAARQRPRQALRRQARDQSALANGLAHEVGSIEVGKWADLVLWRPAFFGVKPSLVIKGAFIALAAMGDPNASIRRRSRSLPADVRRAGRRARPRLAHLREQAALAGGVVDRLGLRRPAVAVSGCRTVRKGDMVHNATTPHMQIDAQTYEVRADGELLTCEPARVLPMAPALFPVLSAPRPGVARPAPVGSRNSERPFVP